MKAKYWFNGQRDDVRSSKATLWIGAVARSGFEIVYHKFYKRS